MPSSLNCENSTRLYRNFFFLKAAKPCYIESRSDCIIRILGDQNVNNGVLGNEKRVYI